METPQEDAPAVTKGTPPAKPFLCFHDRDPVDLVALPASDALAETRPAKVLGSAQRRRGWALLQHGSLLLNTAAPAVELVGLADLARDPRMVRPADAPAGFAPESWVGPWARRLAEALEARLDWREPEPELRERGRVLSEVYRDPAWSFKR